VVTPSSSRLDLRALPAGGYIQIAPRRWRSRPFATVIFRLPSSHSPTAQVESPEPNPIGCRRDLDRAATGPLSEPLHRADVLLDAFRVRKTSSV
jgi:hypothetical protein